MTERNDSSRLADLVRRELDELLTDAERAELRSAAETRPEIAKERAAWATVRTVLAADAEIVPRDGLLEEVVDAATGDGPSDGVVVEGPWRRPAVAAAAVVLLAASFMFGRVVSSTPAEVVAAPKGAEVDEARYREFFRDVLGLTDAEVAAQIEISARYDRRREELRVGLKPQIDALDRAERDEKWRRLTPEARKRWLEFDPRVMPEEGR